MQKKAWIAGVVAAVMVGAVAHASTPTEKIQNDKVRVYEETLAPGEAESGEDKLPSVIVFMSDGRSNAGQEARTAASGAAVHEGETIFVPADARPLKNTGSKPLHLARVVFLTGGSEATWGMTGLPPNYKMLLENRYARVYDIKIAAQSREPRHTHHDRVVVSLSGAQLEHLLPDGTVQPSTLKTGEIVWRRGGTHVGHNLGHTDLWVIAVEPK